MNYSDQVQTALNEAWHQAAASSSLQRWVELAGKEGWELADDSLQLTTRVFGASWYFTRFIFFRGADVIPLFDADRQQPQVVEDAIASLDRFEVSDDISVAIEQLRIQKNELMLSVLLLQLGKIIGQSQAERLLTLLADKVLLVMYRLYGLDRLAQTQCIVLGMGRFAGHEMNYGSDLDLIFIEKVLDQSGYEQAYGRIRKMLRHIAQMDPSGSLYEIDMRLRPHGSSGILVTPLDSFIEFHEGDREIWERQMMTRSRVVCGDSELARQVQQDILDNVYQRYEQSYLASQIMKVRLLVEQELAGGRQKLDLKRGRGGIMDIDFLMHFFQLAHGHADPDFRQTSTRRLINIAEQKGMLNSAASTSLLEAYHFFKTSELALRVFDMKSISKVEKTSEALLPLARAHGHIGDDHQQAVQHYLEQLHSYRDRVRLLFEQILDSAI